MKMPKFPIQRTMEEWQKKLTPGQFNVMRLSGTERAGTSQYNNFWKDGIYNCAGCDNPIYKSDTKFKSHCGWPSFYDAMPGSIVTKTDSSFGMTRTEMMCSKCGSHLGHIFEGEGYNVPTNARHCVNGIALNFKDSKDIPEIN
ncbi:peptide-methionine (R)-S-oxide reductase [Saccharomycopsis crataegensis]|uniref:Peptide-methionine (R)-S-oxide reductase n=1 Tax=Saccharomycopsis crataegensis TaxID=43959 RepID=A0AAV5QH16_9ASCO|nr:peptide-methionine (R)-S-oxide reductase [Saccharomycopsis crataegensis]